MSASPSAARPEPQPLYRRVAGIVERQVRERVLRVGERVPSIRALSVQQKVSISTVLQAYSWLESRGYIEARPRSGYYVRVPWEERLPEPEPRAPRCVPCRVDVAAAVRELMKASHDEALVPLGGAFLSPRLLPTRALNRITRGVLRRHPDHSARYEFSPGAAELRRQIARRSLELGCAFSPAEITVTCGAMEALNLCLRAVARPGDLVAVESPSYYGLLQVIESLGVRALEIPTHPREGMDLDILERQLARRRIAACLAMPCAHNPLGYSLSDGRKRALVELLARHEVPLVEDDVYGELAHDGPRPRPAKAFDRDGGVLLCSSFSKVLGPGHRIGWVHAGRWVKRVDELKSMTTIASPSLSQLAIAELIRVGVFDRHLRRLRQSVREQVALYGDAVRRWFPEGTRVSRPQAGFLLWVQLPEGGDGLRLYGEAVKRGISIMPGAVFSPGGAYRDHVRLSCGHPWSPEMERAVRTLGRLAA